MLPDARVPAAERRRLCGTPFTAPLVDLDTVLGERRLRADFVKVDAESSELEVLRGMAHTLRSSAPMLTVETGDYGVPGQPSTRACIDHLAALGYRCLELDPRDGWREHRPQPSYGYGNLFFTRRR